MPAPRNFRAYVFAIAVMLTHCIIDDRHAGTSTSVTNPSAQTHNLLTGLTILRSGAPDARGEVSVRSTELELSRYGTPTYRLLAYAVADDSGRFLIPVPKGRDAYMEIRQSSAMFATLPPDSLQINFRHWPDGFPIEGGDLASFRLGPPGAVQGFLDTAGWADEAASKNDSTRWIGVRGTDNFRVVRGDGAFRLDEVPSGSQALVIVTVPDTAQALADTASVPAEAPKQFSNIDSACVLTVVPGALTDVGIIHR